MYNALTSSRAGIVEMQNSETIHRAPGFAAFATRPINVSRSLALKQSKKKCVAIRSYAFPGSSTLRASAL